MDRFHDEDIYISSTMVNIAGMPDLSGLTNADRFAMNESDLLQLHGSNLQIFRNLMFFVEADEALSNSPINFGNNFSTIRVRLNRVVAMLEAVMEQRDFFQTGFPTPPAVYLQPNGNELERNTRDLFVLQEMHSYLHVAHYDLYTWYSRHLYNYHASQ
ncbi:uncharacterized protein LOC110973939 [Acanthaster planci]|uniref:Uncharacterized protein LOC110973939 n=1 Tax=Acanthaster planci TaxID=133434 RepID=A0A8B7XJA9_ACAPL|nr:uncharacterized protein LOC110973939 [Acanthaster planci]